MATRLSLEEWRAVYIAMSAYCASVLHVLNIFICSGLPKYGTNDRLSDYLKAKAAA
jgi:hypothetical protein